MLGDINQDVIRKPERVVGEGNVYQGLRGLERWCVECESFMARLAVGVKQRRYGRAVRPHATAEGLDYARDLGRAVVEGRLTTREVNNAWHVQGKSPDFETQLAGEVRKWVELLELRGEVHVDGGAVRVCRLIRQEEVSKAGIKEGNGGSNGKCQFWNTE